MAQGDESPSLTRARTTFPSILEAMMSAEIKNILLTLSGVIVNFPISVPPKSVPILDFVNKPLHWIFSDKEKFLKAFVSAKFLSDIILSITSCIKLLVISFMIASTKPFCI
nr:hypothetical protein [Chlamydia psittaci]